jgi:type I restriction enzyme S subunit
MDRGQLKVDNKKLPEGWEVKKIREIGKVQTGSTPKTSDKNNFGEDIPFIKPPDFKKDGSLNYENQGLSKLGTNEARIIDKNSVLMVCIGATIGKVGFTEKEVTANQQINSLTPLNGNCSKFIFYQMRTEHFQRKVLDSSGQATLPIINKTKWSELSLFLPSPDEQKRIVAILDEAFEGIDQAIANTAKNLANARELFESYLNKIFTQKGDGWEWVSLSEITTDITDGDHQPPPKSQSGIPFITISNIDKQNRKVDFSNTFKVSPEYFEKLKNNRKPRKGDLLYTVTGSYGIPVVVDHDMNFCFQRHIGLIRPNDETNSKCLYYMLWEHPNFAISINA